MMGLTWDLYGLHHDSDQSTVGPRARRARIDAAVSGHVGSVASLCMGCPATWLGDAIVGAAVVVAHIRWRWSSWLFAPVSVSIPLSVVLRPAYHRLRFAACRSVNVLVPATLAARASGEIWRCCHGGPPPRGSAGSCIGGWPRCARPRRASSRRRGMSPAAGPAGGAWRTGARAALAAAPRQAAARAGGAVAHACFQAVGQAAAGGAALGLCVWREH